MLKLVSATLWPRIETLAANSRRKLAAVAFVSDDVRIKFNKGDLLIVDASDKRIAAGDTSKRILADAVRRRAAVFSLRNLHAKLFIFDDTLVIASSNISKSSQRRLHEVGMITDEPSLVNKASELLRQLRAKAQRIDGRFLDRIAKIPVVHDGRNGELHAGKKPTFLELLRSRGPLLEDFAVMLYETGATLTAREIRAKAKSTGAKLPPRDKWTWYEVTPDKETVTIHHRLLEKNELKPIGLEVETDDDDNVTKFVDVDSDVHVFVNQLKVRRKLVSNFIDDSRAPFKFGKRELIRALNDRLRARPNAGKKLGSKPGWILTAKEFAELLGIN